MRLRTKLLLAQAPLAIALALLGITSARSVAQISRNTDLILKDNFRSVIAAERMLAAIRRLDDVALREALAPESGTPETAPLRQRFEAELRVQESNITEPGEAEATAAIRRAWTDCVRALDGIAGVTGEARRRLILDQLEPAVDATEVAAEQVLDLNQEAMVRKSERARREGERTNAVVAWVSAGVLLLAAVVTSALTARLLRPLSILSLSVRRLGEGDLEARARVEGGDEIARLAHEFNTMADRLAQYRRSSLGELLQAQQASQAAIDSLPDPVIVLGADGSLVNVNAAAETVLRISQAAPDPFQALDPGVRAVIDRVHAHVVSGKGPYVPRGFEEALRTESAEGDRWLLPRATPLYSEAGAIVGATIVLQDVTRLMRFDELKNDLVATVAHEFRTPLTSLRMAIHLLAEEAVGPLTQKQADLVFAARQDCERLQSIVDDLLDLSRIQAGRIELHRSPVRTSSILSDAAAAIRPAADAAGIELRVVPPEQDLVVSADAERALLVLSNLLANAIRHTHPGGRVSLSAARAGSAVRFEVADNGEGIPREFLDRVFDKFFQVPGGGGGGVGLGLYISREIVLAHGGAMGVESDPGSGSRFWFTLPLAVAPVAAEPPAA